VPGLLLRCLQAKKNVVSGKVFEAHEEMIKTQKTVETQEQQLQQLQAAVRHHQAQEAAYKAEIEQLRQQLQAARSSAPDAGASQSSRLQLPIQQMLAQQQQQQLHQAAMAALSSRGGLSESVSGSPMAAAGNNSPFAAAGGADSPASKIGRMRFDRTPPRDQDELSLAVSAPSNIVQPWQDPSWALP